MRKRALTELDQLDLLEDLRVLLAITWGLKFIAT